MLANYTVKSLSSIESREIAQVHLTSFPNFFLTSLGIAFLDKFYRSVLSSKEGYGVGVFYNNTLISFAIGTTKTSGFYKELIKTNGLSLFFAALPRIVSQPTKLIRILRNIGGSSESIIVDSAILLSICTLPTFRGKNIGRKTLEAFEHVSRTIYCSNVILTTDAFNNDSVNIFYQRQGYILLDEFETQQSRKMNRYIKKLKTY